MNRWLEINLERRSSHTGELDDRLVSEYVGGKGLALRVLSGLAFSAASLAPGNPVILATGPLTGTHTPTSARSTLVTKSPLFEGPLDSHVGGTIGSKIKEAGFDYIVLKGRSTRPVIVHVSPKGVKFLEADALWGKGIFETEETLKGLYPSASVVSIGPAGENLVRFANVANDKYRHYGRGGAGAVFGYKRLKAIMVEGTEKPNYKAPKLFFALNRALVKDVLNHPDTKLRSELGTMMWIRMGQETGRFLPVRNLQECVSDDYESVSAERMKEELRWKRTGCPGCPIRCTKISEWDDKSLEGPEYETTAFLGLGCGVADAKTIAEANWLCDDLGLDTISCGATIAFAMECNERGLLSTKETAGLRFGNGRAVLETIELIGGRKGIGDILAEGTRRAATMLGKDAERSAMSVRGMEISGVNPKGSLSMGLVLATADFASHTRLWTATDEMLGNITIEELPTYVANGLDTINARNSLIVCDFLPFGLDRLAPLLSAATGLDFSEEGLMLVGERISNLARMMNIESGRERNHDTLPERFFTERMCSGLLEGQILTHSTFDSLVSDYYAQRDWDNQGKPSKEKLASLSLDADSLFHSVADEPGRDGALSESADG